MELRVSRRYRNKDYTIGTLYVNGIPFCDTLEDTDRGIDDSMDLESIRKIKVYSKTAIPTGTYKVTLDVYSKKFGSMPFYQEVCQGKLPRLLDVKGFEGILIHVGNGYDGASLTSGCILVGKNKIKGGLLEGRECFKELYSVLKRASFNKEEIIITIV